jgi:sulfonate transport system substrate-binding protein
MQSILGFLWTALAAAALVLLPQPVGAQAPSEIRLVYPGVGVGNRPVASGNAVATMHLRGMLEKEFEKDGIRITWSFLRGAGPAVNEAYANGLADFSLLGDLPSIIGHAGGLKTRILAGGTVRGNIYVSVPSDSNARTLADLRGKKISVTKGTATHLAIGKILEGFGMTEKDVRLINMETNTATAAIVTGDIDAAVGGSQWLGLRDQGVSRVIFRTTGGDPRFTSNNSFIGREEFIRKYPEHTKRVLKTLLLAAKWLGDQDKNPEPVFQLWTRTGFTFASFKEDWANESLKYKVSPLVDPYIVQRYTLQIEEAKRLGLTRSTFSFSEWVDTSFLEAALRELQLEGYWQPRDEKGQPTRL